MPDPNDDFFIGWQPGMPKPLLRRVRAMIAALLLMIAGIGVLLAALQQTYGISRYDWAEQREFSGIFRTSPYPHLLIHVPNSQTCQAYMLVDEFKEGWNPGTVKGFDGEYVTLTGGIIYRGTVAMLEGNPATALKPAEQPVDFPSADHGTSLGQMTLIGEIVDSKCYYGAMNPGNLKPHRACAIVCIKGGVPPVLLVRRNGQAPLYYYLVDVDGSPLSEEILPFVAQPVSLDGEVIEACGLAFCRINPASIRRL